MKEKMPKIKTKKTLLKRVKITKGGKMLKKHIKNSHLKVKLGSNSKYRKNRNGIIESTGYRKMFRKLLGKQR
ncbi:hypothetical protein A3H26_00835 [candidate division WWE3 bacterium RIFCSPLOWO2_12_FULL_36_10]|uniref:Large ribosomal subunit protein bL35 n=1 Tax=candidate division WWE3 bacterium RIFCSPLOWO2_12_FULL_36_10 TaxID=1802630 RepID=A0A1F4VLY8_UNCKA|nr:MAG: hypothetical protein A3H26_00835 [candidate division WWE3 bacterium RIFCSPLOWO2_12_FULL_36_10]